MPLSAKQLAVAVALAAGKSVPEAAGEHDCGERTVRRWAAEVEDFRAHVQALRAELFSLAAGKLSALGGQAAQTLGELLGADGAGIRLQAARSILEHAVRIREATDIEDRLAALERRHKVGRKRP
jgi:hypothetical protein